MRIQIYLKAIHMATAEIEYLGNLRTKCVHLKSGVEIITDAPTDNNGKGESFSPTDLVATAYVSCMFTIIGIHCNSFDLKFESGKATMTKSMGSAPRRVTKIEIDMDRSGNDWSTEEQGRIVRAAEACPVAKSVHSDMEIVFNYKF